VVDLERHYCSFNSRHVDLVLVAHVRSSAAAARLITSAILLDPSLWLRPTYLMSYPPRPAAPALTTQSYWNMWHGATNCAMAT